MIMALTKNDIRPAAKAATNATAASPSPNNEQEVFASLPEPVKALPVVQWLSIGEPPAVRIEPGQYFPELEPIGQHLPEIIEGGLDAWKSKGGELVLFNPLFIDPGELQLAEESGKLDQLVPTYAELSGSDPQPIPDDKFSGMLEAQDDLQRRLQELSAPDESTETPPQSSAPIVADLTSGGQVSAPPPPSPAQTRIAQTRLKQLQPGAPTSGPAPGAGRLLNGLLRRTV